MSNNMYYWLQKEKLSEKAKEHTEYVKAQYAHYIKESIEKSVVFGYPDLEPKADNMTADPSVELIDKDTVSAFFEKRNGRTAILNFASYKNPGGMFMKGSSAQEESLCHASFLYNVLCAFDSTYYEWNRRHRNKALYTNRAIFSPNVVFEKEGYRPAFCHVITCAAPNYTAAGKYGSVTRADNHDALYSRIVFVKQIAEHFSVGTIILGAFGCGVFGQDPVETAGIFKDVFGNTTVSRVVYAIPTGKNYDAFHDVFGIS